MADDSNDFNIGAVGQSLGRKIASCFMLSHDQTSQLGAMDPSNEYDFSHGSRGIAVIITNSRFEATSERAGAENDTKLFRKAFQRMGFIDIRIAVDLTANEMMQTLKSVAKEKDNLKNSDCIAVAFSSHGDEYVSYHRDAANVKQDVINGTDEAIRTQDLIEIFNDINCPELVGKPRLFFIQACRGKTLDVGVEVKVVKDMDVVDSMTDVTVSPAPCFKDFLVIYATPPGHFAFRRPSEGSWFVKCLADVMSTADIQNMSLNKLLTRVMKKVSFSYQSGHSDPRLDAKKQSPCFYSMLTKDVYFTATPDEEEEMSM